MTREEKKEILDKIGKNLTEMQMIDLIFESAESMARMAACRELISWVGIANEKDEGLQRICDGVMEKHHILMGRQMARIYILLKVYQENYPAPKDYIECYKAELKQLKETLDNLKL